MHSNKNSKSTKSSTKSSTKKYTDVKRYRGELAINYHKNKVIETRVDVSNWSREQIRQFMQEESNRLKKKGFKGALATAINYDEGGGWKAGYWSQAGDPIKLWSPDDSGNYEGTDQTTFSTFSYYAIPQMPVFGGSDEHNDCLYNVLKKAIPPSMFPWKSPEEFKKILGVARDDKIDIALIPQIEKELPNHQINVVGDHIYTSTKKAQLRINISLIESHYELVSEKKCYRININYKERKIMVYEKMEKGQVRLFDGVDYQVKSMKDMKQEIFGYSENYVYFKLEKKKKKGVMTLSDYYLKIVHDAKEIKRESRGLINLWKTGNAQNTALNLFDKFTKIITPEPLLQDEAHWISEATNGAMIWATPYKGELHKYDFCSFYPSILRDSKFLIPVKRGDFYKWNQDKLEQQKYFQYGIYRVRISPEISASDLINVKSFRFNKSHYYTHFDLTMAKELKLQMKIIDDGKPNVLLYSRDKLYNSSWLFKDYVNTLFALKKKEIGSAKDILNVLWGLLSQRKMKRKFANKMKPVDILGENYIYSIKPDGDGTSMKTFSYNKFFKYDYARLCPFLLAKGRVQIVKKYIPALDKVVMAHTDGFILKEKYNFDNMGDGLGQIKYEGFCQNGKVKNVNNVIGQFK